MRIALAQINPTVGDLSGNVDRMVDAAAGFACAKRLAAEIRTIEDNA